MKKFNKYRNFRNFKKIGLYSIYAPLLFFDYKLFQFIYAFYQKRTNLLNFKTSSSVYMLKTKSLDLYIKNSQRTFSLLVTKSIKKNYLINTGYLFNFKSNRFSLKPMHRKLHLLVHRYFSGDMRPVRCGNHKPQTLTSLYDLFMMLIPLTHMIIGGDFL